MRIGSREAREAPALLDLASARTADGAKDLLVLSLWPLTWSRGRDSARRAWRRLMDTGPSDTPLFLHGHGTGKSGNDSPSGLSDHFNEAHAG